LPRAAAFLLEPLVLDPVSGEASPPGGTLRQRIRQGLDAGGSVVVFPDGPAGAPAHLSRFRLDAFYAALETSSPVYPVGIRNTPDVLRAPGGSPFQARNSPSTGKGNGREHDPQVRVGEPVYVDDQGIGQREIAGLRERIRRQIATLVDREK
jgi:1-acyl-sn-glycerol-3-phosphate acyltransferase